MGRQVAKDVALAQSLTIDCPVAALADATVGACTVTFEAIDWQQLATGTTHQVGGVPQLFIAWSHLVIRIFIVPDN